MYILLSSDKFSKIWSLNFAELVYIDPLETYLVLDDFPKM